MKNPITLYCLLPFLEHEAGQRNLEEEHADATLRGSTKVTQNNVNYLLEDYWYCFWKQWYSLSRYHQQHLHLLCLCWDQRSQPEVWRGSALREVVQSKCCWDQLLRSSHCEPEGLAVFEVSAAAAFLSTLLSGVTVRAHFCECVSLHRG